MKLRLVACLVLGAAAPAQAYMPPQAYIKMRAEASYHLQVTVGFVAPSTAKEGFGYCPVTGSISTIFRDKSQSLRPGESITFAMPCQVRKDAAMPVGGTAWHDYGKLRRAKVIEVFLFRGADGFKVADQGDGERYLDAPTATPTVVDQR